MITFQITRGGLRRRQWRFKIVANNNKILASSELYHNYGDAEAACALIKEAAGRAQIVNMTQ